MISLSGAHSWAVASNGGGGQPRGGREVGGAAIDTPSEGAVGERQRGRWRFDQVIF